MIDLSAREIIALLKLQPHPEGGHFAETFRDETRDGSRAYSSAIYYLLKAGEVSHWHRIDSAEVWHFYAGAPLRLAISSDGTTEQSFKLGANIAAGERPQLIVPRGAWQSAVALGDWSLVGCTVAPAFTYDRFELAPKGWFPGTGS